MATQRVNIRHVAAMLLFIGALHAQAQAPTDAAAALEAQIKLKELQLKLLQADQNLKDAELKALEQSKKEVAAQRLLARQADAEKLLDLQAEGAVSGAQLTNELLLATKLKDAFGDAPKIGKEGAISISDGSTTQLLVTRSGSAWASLKIANQICDDLKTAKVEGAYIAPTGFDEKVVRSRLFKAEVDSLKRYADEKKAVFDGVPLQSVATVVVGLQAARYLIGGAQELSKALRPDYGFSIAANSSRAALIEKSIAARCPTVLANADLETFLRLGMGSTALSDSLNTLIDFADTYDGKLSGLTSQLNAAKEDLAAEKAKSKEERSAEKIDTADRKVKGFQPLLKQLQLVEPAAKRVKTFLDSLKTRQAEVIEALVWAGFDNKWKDKPRLQLTVSTQDVQINKTSAWSGQKISAAAHVEALFHVIDKDGKVMVSGVRLQSATSPELALTKASKGAFAGCVVVADEGTSCP